MDRDTESVALARLEDQITWYDRKSCSNQRTFKLLKGWTILIGAAVPVLVAVGWSDARVVALLTATIAVVEGLQQLNQHQTNWILYRATCEALKHEKYLYLARAGPYATAANRESRPTVNCRRRELTRRLSWTPILVFNNRGIIAFT
jgi:hypothetical protein